MDPVAYKIVILGDSDVGKTSIIRCFDQQTFDASLNPTVGASFLSKIIQTGNGPVALNIWDTAGQERYRSLIPTYAHGARAAILCYDVSSVGSFESVDSWLKALHKFCSEDCKLYLVGNKIDLSETIAKKTARQWALDHNAQTFFTSAKLGVGVADLFKAIAESLVITAQCDHQRRGPIPRDRKGCCS
jgi:small GTP-binding protein